MICRLALLLSLPVCLAVRAHSLEEAQELHCAKSHLFLAPTDSSGHRKYAPDRSVDVLHLAIDVTPHFTNRTVAGTTTLKFKPIAKAIGELRLDAMNLAISSVTSSEPIKEWQNTGENLIVTFASPIPADKEARVVVKHSAEPVQGLYFRTPEMGYKQGDTHLFTQGEPVEARHWYPCYDAPNEKFTSEVTCHVPAGMTALSNGRLLSETPDAATGLTAFRWMQEKPHVNYLITLVAGYFRKVEDRHKDIPMAFYTPPSQISEAMSAFKETKAAMEFFEEEIGVPYPWAKYDQVCVNDFVAGGMENTSISTLTDNTLFHESSENIHSARGLMAHELAHQWFGDLVTCKDWTHLWLNEGFATYYAHLFDGKMSGKDEMLYGLYDSARRFIDRSDDTTPIADRKFNSPLEQFSHRAYQKGAWVLHMLRAQLGEDLYRKCVKTYLERHQYDTVVTEDFNSVIEELSGRSFDRFFDQWVYRPRHPELEVSYAWDAKTQMARVSVSQSQKLDDHSALFQFPLAIRFKSKSGAQDREIMVKEKSEDFYFALPEAPQIVRIDPEYITLAKVRFSVPDPMLHAQLADASDVMGRIFAIEQMRSKKDRATVEKLKAALKEDAFYGVRVEAAKALRDIHSDDAYSALKDASSQADARVRRQVAIALADFYRPDTAAQAVSLLAQEKNPDIRASWIAGLAPYPDPALRDILLESLKTESYRNRITEAAVQAMRAQDDPACIAPLSAALRTREAAFTSRGLSSALDALAHLSRHQENKDDTRALLVKFLSHQRRNVKQGAINALGALGDPKAVAILDTFASAGRDNPEREAAARAIAAIRAARKPADDLGDLRKEVMDLQKANRDLRKEMDALKKQFEARPAAPPPAPEEPAKSRKPAAKAGKGK